MRSGEEEGGLRYPPWLVARRRALRIVAIVMSVSSGALVVAAFVLTWRTEAAFDESRCPWRAGETKDVAPEVHVRDDARTCLSDLAEHRFIVTRRGQAPLEIGRRRLGTARWAPGVWSWEPTLADGHVHVRVVNPGAGPVTYKEEQMRER